MNPRGRKFWVLMVIFLTTVIFVFRITGAVDLEDNSQSRNVGYAIDLISHGNWLVQYDIQGRILSKPPLHTWLVALFAIPFGLNRVTLALPSFLSVVAMGLLVLEIGRRRFGLLAGGLAALALVMSQMMWRQVGMVRSDALFSLAIAGGAWGAFRAWETGKGWTLFWVCGAVATLTKGPLGLLLSAAGLLAWFWENRTNAPALKPKGSHVAGLFAFLAICSVWIVPALCFHAKPLIDKMIFEELLGHVTSADDTRTAANLWLRFATPTINLLTKFAPFSLFTCYAVFRAFASPSENDGERRFERFLTCWLLSGLLVFTIAAHHRADLLLPLWPAAALLAGREMAKLGERLGSRTLVGSAAAACLLVLAGVWFGYHPTSERRLRSFRRSIDVKEAAEAFAKTDIDPQWVHYLDVPATFQFYLGTSSRWTTPKELMAARDPAQRRLWVATEKAEIDPARFGMPEVTEVFRWPQTGRRGTVVRVFELHWPSRKQRTTASLAPES